MKASQRVVNFVRTTIQSYIEEGMRSEVYSEYRNLNVQLDPNDIRNIQCSFDVKPVGTLTWITVDFGFFVN